MFSSRLIDHFSGDKFSFGVTVGVFGVVVLVRYAVSKAKPNKKSNQIKLIIIIIVITIIIIIIIIKRCLPQPVACTNRLNTLHKRTG